MLLLYTGESRNSSMIQQENQNINEQIRYKSLENIARIADNVKNKIINEDLILYPLNFLKNLGTKIKIIS